MSREILVLTEAELRSAVALDRALVDAIEAAFAALHGGGVVMPPVLSMDLPAVHGEVDVKTAWVPGQEVFAIKVSPGFFGNPTLGLPSLNGLMVALSATTGLVEAVFLDNGLLTDLRTAAAGAVAARHLAPVRVETAAVLGTGMQARLQMRAAHLERPFSRCLVWGRDRQKAEACAADIAAATGADCAVASSVDEAVAAASLVVTATPSREPLIRAAALHEGLHVTAMGSDQAGKSELAPEAVAAADLYVADRESQTRVMGELRAALEAGLWHAGRPVTELGAVVAGDAPGRTDAAQITIADLTGTGVQDTAIAARALAAARAAGAGTVVRA